jgi:cyclophilin family peptidyl-prolyl cis-trans isomerase
MAELYVKGGKQRFIAALVVACLTIGCAASAKANPIVLFNTSLGSFQVELFENAAPQTVANFLKYVNAGEYDNTFFHRTATIAQSGIGIVQGGGFSAASAPFPPAPPQIPSLTNPALPLESVLPNSLGTIAMARTSVPTSGTSQFFFNSHDNTNTLPAGASGGYTVFGQVLGNGLSILQAIEATKKLNDYFQIDPSNPLGPIPLVNFDPVTATQITASNLIIVNSVTLVPEPSTIVLALMSGVGFVAFAGYRTVRRGS